ncbi:MAG TPA: inorganic phosphate transporter [Mucilaginibacter sp.]|jgi:PiT family inorganic phosphate transporter|nr:inorganic phosphate transporter [Mucilaginibacter sp.]
MTVMLIIIIAFGLIFDFINGFHDSANSIATIVSTKVLTPFQAVLWAGFFNFVAYFIFRDHKVANTVASIVHPQFVDLRIVIAGLIAAISWNLLTWWFGIPSSSSHTLIGGFIGAAIAKMGSFDVIVYKNLIKTVSFILLSPLIGMILAFCITLIVVWLSRNSHPFKADRWFKRLQLMTSAVFSIGHGGNDAQKTMGLIALALTTEHLIPGIKEMPLWVPLTCYVAMGCGTMFGGWRIVKTMGTRITKVTPLEGVCAETAAASTLIFTELLGIPVSTTHTIAGSIIGVGATKRLSAVRWGVTINLLWAWILTIPVSALLAAGIYSLMRLFF